MYIRRLKIKKVFLLMLVGLFLISGKEVYAFDEKAKVPLVIEQHFDDQSGKLSKTEKTGMYMIQSVEDGNPMPENSVKGSYSFKIDDAGKYTIPLFFQHAGIYNYTINQVIERKKDYTFDDTKYTVTVYVKNAESGGLASEVIVKNGNEKKCSEIGFYNSYNFKQMAKKTSDGKDKRSNVAKTGDDSPLVKWAAFAILSFVCILVILNKKKKRV